MVGNLPVAMTCTTSSHVCIRQPVTFILQAVLLFVLEQGKQLWKEPEFDWSFLWFWRVGEPELPGYFSVHQLFAEMVERTAGTTDSPGQSCAAVSASETTEGSVHKAGKEDTYDSVQRQRVQRR